MTYIELLEKVASEIEDTQKAEKLIEVVSDLIFDANANTGRHTFKYWIELDDGYRPVGSTDVEHEMAILINASCRAEADRKVKAMLDGGKVSVGVCMD